jgi:2-oxo-4-hydroxy-4-carboxy--5-ureidoimidazoline (OHCU) decarboxylase
VSSVPLLSPLPPLEAVNGSSAALASALRLLFETDEPLEPRLRGLRPFASYDDLLDKATMQLASASREDKVRVLDAHPPLGESADRLRARSVVSWREQAGGDGGDAPAGSHELAHLSELYERRFGFRLVVFVNGRSVAELVPEIRGRLAYTADGELATGIAAAVEIARERARRLHPSLQPNQP